MTSLSLISTDFIIQNFDEIFQRCTDDDRAFLQRKSTDFLPLLSKEGKLNDEHLDFFLNSFLKILDSKWFDDSKFRDSIQDIIYLLPNLRKVCLPVLCNDEILEKIAMCCPHIVIIDVSDSHVTDTGIKYLCGNANRESPCPKLKKIFIKNSNVTEEGVRYLLQNLKSLQEIDYETVPEILADLSNLENIQTYNLIKLNLRSKNLLGYRKRHDYYEILKICVSVCPNLQSLECVLYDKEPFDFIKNITNLKRLCLKIHTSTQPIDINHLLIDIGKNLTFLEILNCLVSINVISSCCPKLKVLDINNTTFTEHPDFPYSIFQNLNECSFTRITFESTNNRILHRILSSSPNLESLAFNNCNLSPETENILKCCHENLLKCINFFQTPVEFTFIKEILLTYSSLKTMKLSNINFRKKLTDFLQTYSYKPAPDVFIDCIHYTEYDRLASYYY